MIVTQQWFIFLWFNVLFIFCHFLGQLIQIMFKELNITFERTKAGPNSMWTAKTNIIFNILPYIVYIVSGDGGNIEGKLVYHQHSHHTRLKQ